MKSPDAPPTVPDPSLLPLSPVVLVGAGPDQMQAAYAAASARVAVLADRKHLNLHGRGVRTSTTSQTNPQRFPVRPSLDELAVNISLGSEQAGAHLPGRIPPTAWDGEPGAGAVNIGD